MTLDSFKLWKKESKDKCSAGHTYPCRNRPLETIPSCHTFPMVRRAAHLSPKLQSRRTVLASFNSALSTTFVVLDCELASTSDTWCWNRLAWIRVSSTSRSPGTRTKLLGYRNRVPAAKEDMQKKHLNACSKYSATLTNKHWRHSWSWSLRQSSCRLHVTHQSACSY